MVVVTGTVVSKVVGVETAARVTVAVAAEVTTVVVVVVVVPVEVPVVRIEYRSKILLPIHNSTV